MNKLVVPVSLACAIGCSSSTKVEVTQATATAVSNSQRMDATKVEGFAKGTPPAGAQSMGMMDAPKAGPATLPIHNVEVFAFTANLTGADETLYWAASSGVVYVWGQVPLECVDAAGQSTGETGVADLVYAATSGGYGWMTATDSCGYTTYFGCSSSGGGEVCGGCDFNDDFIACVAEASS
jgi:hypothetical protein